MSKIPLPFRSARLAGAIMLGLATTSASAFDITGKYCDTCLLYTSPSPRDRQKSRMPSSA